MLQYYYTIYIDKYHPFNIYTESRSHPFVPKKWLITDEAATARRLQYRGPADWSKRRFFSQHRFIIRFNFASTTHKPKLIKRTKPLDGCWQRTRRRYPSTQSSFLCFPCVFFALEFLEIKILRHPPPPLFCVSLNTRTHEGIPCL